MLSFTQQQALFQSLSQNATTANATLYGKLANIEHRYLLQKYFNNETSFQITTVGGSTQTLTAIAAVGATSATLTASWTGNTTQIEIQVDSGDFRAANCTTGSATITWTAPLTGTNTTTSITIGGQQFYPLPPNYSKLKTITITIGELKWTLDEISDRASWDKLNVFPYYADIPANYFIYPGGDHGAQIGVWPIPSTTGNVITFNYKFRVPDLSLADYVGSSGHTISVNNNSTAVTGSSTSFVPTTNAQLESRWLQIAQPDGDNLWYQISGVASSTALTLYQPYQGVNVSASQNFTIGQMPLIAEDFQDMLVWKALVYYFSSIVDNPDKAKEWQQIYNEKLALLQAYSGSNSVQVNLSKKRSYKNPNVYQIYFKGN